MLRMSQKTLRKTTFFIILSRYCIAYILLLQITTNLILIDNQKFESCSINRVEIL